MAEQTASGYIPTSPTPKWELGVVVEATYELLILPGSSYLTHPTG